MRESRIQECGNAADKNAENTQTSLRESSAPDCGNPADIHTGDYTEITSEITAEKNLYVRRLRRQTNRKKNL